MTANFRKCALVFKILLKSAVKSFGRGLTISFCTVIFSNAWKEFVVKAVVFIDGKLCPNHVGAVTAA